MAQKTPKKSVTIDQLAAMVQKGFEHTANKVDTATKDDLKDLATKKEMKELRHELVGKIEGINRRLDAMADYNRRIARLERIVDTLTLSK